MKKKLSALFLLLAPLMLLGQEAAEQGIDEKIDAAFGWATGWFVQGIFYQIPFSENVNIPWVLFPLILPPIFTNL